MFVFYKEKIILTENQERNAKNDGKRGEPCRGPGIVPAFSKGREAIREKPHEPDLENRMTLEALIRICKIMGVERWVIVGIASGSEGKGGTV